MKKVLWWKLHCWSRNYREESEYLGWILCLEGDIMMKLLSPVLHFGEIFELNSGEGCMRTMQCNVNFVYQLSIFFRTEGNHWQYWSNWPIAVPSGWMLSTCLSSASRLPKEDCFLEGSHAFPICPGNSNVWMKMMEWHWQGKLGEEPVSVPLFPPQILHGLAWNRIRASAGRKE